MIRTIYIAMLLFLGAGSLPAAEQTVYDSAAVESRWLGIPGSARLAALGHAFVARGAEVQGMELNPAALSGIRGWQVLFTHNAWIEGMAVERLAAGWRMPCIGTFGASLDYLDLGQVEKIDLDASGQLVETGQILRPSSMALGLSYARDFGRLSAGITARGLVERGIAGAEAFGAAAQFGLGVRYSYDQDLTLGLSLQNLALDLSPALKPIRLRAGVARVFRLARPLAAEIDVDWQPYDHETPALRLGTEWAIHTQALLRLGYVSANERTPRGLTAGAGWIKGPLALDYALYGAGDLGLTHIVTLSWTGLP